MRKVQMKANVIELESPTRSGDERSEPERSVELSSSPPPAFQKAEAKIPDPEVNAKANRRRFSSEYKLRILQEADSCGYGSLAALLRREGLYSSLLAKWRLQREQAEIAVLKPRKRGRKAIPRNPLSTENDRLQRENKRLENRLRKAEIIIDVQKKTLRPPGTDSASDRAERERRMIACQELSMDVGIVEACNASDVARPIRETSLSISEFTFMRLVAANMK